ncbi:DNA-binding SARP family transcriptional activator/predicted negative regulator of RcsB-dependent stress response [Catenulispora sp. GAS73]|uniref:AfsR/SARP family transcriptional regulator n=1 Tax=Catenulispora sp. GAS73 TaxID=3156269 RepID=UPI00351690B6
MRFGLLGPLEVIVEDQPIPLTGGIPKAVLGVLLADANRVVSIGVLADRIWQGDPPAAAVASVHNHVMRLRRQLGPQAGPRIRTAPPGYVIDVADDELDVSLFQDACRKGRRALGDEDWKRARDEFAAALDLWRGEPGAGLTDGVIPPTAAQPLRELRWAAYDGRIQADLQLGRHHEILPDLRTLTAENPLAEDFHAKLMLALYRGGRQADALHAYGDLRKTLIAELGVEPSARVRELHQRILTNDPRLELRAESELAPAGKTAPGSPPDRTPQPVIAQLPAAVADFSGRQEEVAALAEVFAADTGPGQIAIAAVTGSGGLGKTTLAVRVAHLLAPGFPDGQFFADLHGADQVPRDPAEVLFQWLVALGDPPREVAPDLDSRAARFRSLTYGRRYLVVLDNAAGSAQARPLLPASETSGVLITSRNRLSQLPGCTTLDLTPLRADAAQSLLERIVGTERLGAEAAAADDLLQACGGLPLALRIVGARLAARQSWTITSFAARLRDERYRLDELAIGDTAVRSVFQTSYASLADRDGAELARAFRLLGLIPGPDFGPHAVAALIDRPLRQAEQLVEKLVDANLLEAPAFGRYRFHDLIKSYAHELVEQEDSAEERRAARTRLAGWYLYADLQALNQLNTHRPTVDISQAEWCEPAIGFADAAQATAWYEAEYPALLKVQEMAADEQLGAVAWLIPRVTYPFMRLRGLMADITRITRLGLAAAEAAGDLVGQARLLNTLGGRLEAEGRIEESLAAADKAQSIFEALGDLAGQALALVNMGDTLCNHGRVDESYEYYQRALLLYEGTGRVEETALTLNNLAYAYDVGGRFQDAIDTATEAVGWSRVKSVSPDTLGSLVDTLGMACFHQGDFDAAADWLRQAVDAYVEAGDTALGADTLDHYGDVLQAAGRPAEAQAAWKESLDWFDGAGDSDRAEEIRAKLNALVGP